MSESNADMAVEVRGLCKRFGHLTAVAGIDFQIRRGEVFGFLGPNGSGKTTTIRMLCGILPPTSGTGTVLGLDVIRQSETIKTRIGYMSQKFSLYDDLTVLENLEFYAGVQSIPRSERGNRIRELLTLSSLDDRTGQLAGQLSGGWKQRLALACALVHRPEMVFLDEPTSGVDPVSRRRFWDVIYRVADMGTTVLVTTHYMDEAEQFDRLVFIYQGRLIAEGTPAQLKERSFNAGLWQIACAPLAAASEALKGAPFALDVTIVGTVLHVITSEDFNDTAALRAPLDRAGITIESIEPIAPTLEDVFVYLTETLDNAVANAGGRS